MKKFFQPFARLSKSTFTLMIISQVVIGLLLWQFTSDGLIPKPGKVAAAFMHLLGTSLLWDNILVSLGLTLQAMLYAIVITLKFSYLSVVPFFRSLALFLVKCRYLTLTGLIFVFTLLNKRWKPAEIVAVSVWYRAVFCDLVLISDHAYQQAGI